MQARRNSTCHKCNEFIEAGTHWIAQPVMPWEEETDFERRNPVHAASKPFRWVHITCLRGKYWTCPPGVDAAALDDDVANLLAEAAVGGEASASELDSFVVTEEEAAAESGESGEEPDNDSDRSGPSHPKPQKRRRKRLFAKDGAGTRTADDVARQPADARVEPPRPGPFAESALGSIFADGADRKLEQLGIKESSWASELLRMRNKMRDIGNVVTFAEFCSFAAHFADSDGATAANCTDVPTLADAKKTWRKLGAEAKRKQKELWREDVQGMVLADTAVHALLKRLHEYARALTSGTAVSEHQCAPGGRNRQRPAAPLCLAVES